MHLAIEGVGITGGAALLLAEQVSEQQAVTVSGSVAVVVGEVGESETESERDEVNHERIVAGTSICCLALTISYA